MDVLAKEIDIVIRATRVDSQKLLSFKKKDFHTHLLSFL